MSKLTRGERFQDARLVHNKNGKQTMDEVEAATKIPKSKIHDLEDDSKDRKVGYTNIATLAKHYGVTSDFLLGLSDNPFPKGFAVDDLGISREAVEFIKTTVKKDENSLELDDNSTVFNYLFDKKLFAPFFGALCTYFNSKRAHFLYDSLEQKYNNWKGYDPQNLQNLPEGTVLFPEWLETTLYKNMMPEELPENARREDFIPPEICDYLFGELEYHRDWDFSRNYLYALTTAINVQLSDITEGLARKALDEMLRSLDKYAEMDGRTPNNPKCLYEAMR